MGVNAAQEVLPENESFGLSLQWDDLGKRNVETLFLEGALTRSLLEKHGYIHIANYVQSQSEREEYSLPMSGVYVGNKLASTQWLHRDRDTYADRPDAVSLRYTGRSGRRGFATLLARETDALYEECVKAFKDMHYIRGITSHSFSPVQQFIEAVRSEILDKGIVQDRSPCLIEYAGPTAMLRRSLREFLFHGSAGDILTNQPVLDSLYETLIQKNLANRHEWKKNDLMLIDNRGTTLHARAPSAHPAKITRGGEDFRRYFSWNENCRNMFYLESGD